MEYKNRFGVRRLALLLRPLAPRRKQEDNPRVSSSSSTSSFSFGIWLRTMAYFRDISLGSVVVGRRRVRMCDSAVRIAQDYGEGRMTVEAFVRISRSYRGPAPHYLLADYAPDDGCMIFLCMRYIPDESLHELVKALIADNPQVLAMEYNGWGGLLHHAMGYASGRILLLLAVREATRLIEDFGSTPLHVACRTEGVDPEVIHRLMDLDPDVLTLRNHNYNEVPLHEALERDPSSSYVQRMMKLRPETLYFRDCHGETPVARAIGSRREKTGRAAILRRLVKLYPWSVALPEDAPIKERSPLIRACERHARNDPELVRVVLEAHPQSLVVPHEFTSGIPLLPYEAPPQPPSGTIETDVDRDRGGRTLAFVQEETAHMALAIVEYVLGVNVSSDADAAANVVWFQNHVKDALREHYPEVQLEGSPGLSVAQSLLLGGGQVLVPRNDNEHGPVLLDLIRSLFCHARVAKLLSGDGHLLRNAVLCDTVVDMYRMNRQGRYRPLVQSPPRDEDGAGAGNSIASAAWHQVELLSSLQDSTSVESTYLQFREVSHLVLLVHGPGSDGARQSSVTGKAVSRHATPRPTKDRKRSSHGAGLLGNDAPEDDGTSCTRPSKRTSR